MEALVLGRAGNERARLERVLADANVTLNACHDHNWGCIGMHGDCPLDSSAVDVAVAVAEPSGRFDAQGIACVHRARIPVVAVGATADDPVLEYADVSVARVDDSIIEVLRVAAHNTSGHKRAIDDSLSEHLEEGERVVVSVAREPGGIHVYLVTDIVGRRAAALADVARAALRDYDRRVAVIDVSVIDSGME